jgi:hypothetical protein
MLIHSDSSHPDAPQGQARQSRKETVGNESEFQSSCHADRPIIQE